MCRYTCLPRSRRARRAQAGTRVRFRGSGALAPPRPTFRGRIGFVLPPPRSSGVGRRQSFCQGGHSSTSQFGCCSRSAAVQIQSIVSMRSFAVSRASLWSARTNPTSLSPSIWRGFTSTGVRSSFGRSGRTRTNSGAGLVEHATKKIVEIIAKPIW